MLGVVASLTDSTGTRPCNGQSMPIAGSSQRTHVPPAAA
jgi:hypothetical protein